VGRAFLLIVFNLDFATAAAALDNVMLEGISSCLQRCLHVRYLVCASKQPAANRNAFLALLQRQHAAQWMHEAASHLIQSALIPGKHAVNLCITEYADSTPACRLPHGVLEATECPALDATVTVHVRRYRTQWCHDGSNCTRKICFFAHSLEVGSMLTDDHMFKHQK
jgi:hypothetical protein